jgi:hypothetical protein
MGFPSAFQPFCSNSRSSLPSADAAYNVSLAGRQKKVDYPNILQHLDTNLEPVKILLSLAVYVTCMLLLTSSST